MAMYIVFVTLGFTSATRLKTCVIPPKLMSSLAPTVVSPAVGGGLRLLMNLSQFDTGLSPGDPADVGPSTGPPQFTLLIATGVLVPGISALLTSFTKNANTSLNWVFTKSLYSVEPNT